MTRGDDPQLASYLRIEERELATKTLRRVITCVGRGPDETLDRIGQHA